MDLNTCAAKDCGKPRFLDYYVCAEHFAFYAAPQYTDSMLVKADEVKLETAPFPDFSLYPELFPASPPSSNPRRPIQQCRRHKARSNLLSLRSALRTALHRARSSRLPRRRKRAQSRDLSSIAFRGTGTPVGANSAGGQSDSGVCIIAKWEMALRIGLASVKLRTIGTVISPLRYPRCFERWCSAALVKFSELDAKANLIQPMGEEDQADSVDTGQLQHLKRVSRIKHIILQNYSPSLGEYLGFSTPRACVL